MEQLEKLDIQRIRKFNSEVNEQKKKASELIARMEFNKGELKRLCDELTVELGVPVTPENIEEIYKQCVAKINNSLTTGEEILNRIKNDEYKDNTESTTQVTNQYQQEPQNLDFDGINNYSPGIGEDDSDSTIDFNNLPRMF